MQFEKKDLIALACFLVVVSSVFSGLLQAQEYSKHQLQTFNVITKKVESLGEKNWRFAPIAPLNSDVIPLFWGDHKAYTGDVRWPQNSCPPVAVAGEYKKGRFIALAHDGLLIDPSANDVFTSNILNWLGNGYKYKKVIIYTHIGGWFKKSILTVKAKHLLASKGVEIIDLGSKVNDEDLKECDLFIIVRPAKNISQDEIDSIVSYVERGGSILMTGMGWLWESQNKSGGIKSFPLNKLGERLGFEYSKRIIHETPQDNKGYILSSSNISYKPLSERKPVEIRSYSLEQGNRFITRDIARNGNKYYYVIEGEHVVVSMPYRFWIKCRGPEYFIKRLDEVYELYADLTDGVKPFDSKKILILNVDNLYFNMCSGNPILSRDNRIEYIIGELEKSKYRNPSWGLMHELGHDFIISMKHRFVFGNGDNESWAEFFALYGCQKFGLKPDKEPAWLETVRAYHISGEQDFERIKNEKWLMIGFLHHIQKQYGWDVYKKLFKRYAQFVRENDYPDIQEIINNDQETEKKVNVFVKELSLAAGANFYPYFHRWGFPVNPSINEELKHLPEAKLFK